MELKELINTTFPLFEDMQDTEVAQTIWRRRGAEILGERIKDEIINAARNWLNEHEGCTFDEFKDVMDELI